MPLINRIQKEILALNGGQFQKLADDYLYKLGYKNLTALGSAVGSNKVRKGTPDSYSKAQGKGYVFKEYTTQADINGSLLKKLEEDIEKCLDESKTGLKVEEIDEIVLCHTGQLKANELAVLTEMCKVKKVNFNQFGIDQIAYDLKEKYKGLAKDHLNIEVDTGQILKKDEFISSYTNNSFVTSLKTKVVGREKEISKIVSDLEFSNLVIISGGQGTGKTRIAIEAVGKFVEEKNEFDDYYIFNRFDQDLFNDLHILMSESSNIILLVDDANRISRFDYVIQYLSEVKEGFNLKIVATVRDYARNQIEGSIQKLESISRIEIIKLEEAQINELLGNEYDITNQEYLNRINEIADGNPRLAMMAGKIAVQSQSLLSLSDVSDLYSKYYESIEGEFKELKNPEYLKIAGTISFFRAIDFKNDTLMESLRKSIQLDKESIIRVSNKLHSMELVDIYEDEVVKVSDQIISTYILYLACFKEKVLSFGDLLESYYPEYRSKFVDALNPIFSSFEFETLKKVIHPSLEEKIKEFTEQGSQNELIELLDFFWFLRIDKTLLLIKKIVDEIEEVESMAKKYDEIIAVGSTEKNTILSILSGFKRTEIGHYRSAVQLLIMILKKNFNYIGRVFKIFNEGFSFEYDSFKYGYVYQEILMNELWKVCKNGDHNFRLLFIKLSKSFLKTSFSSTKNSRGNSISLINFELYQTEKLESLRGKVWERLMTLYKEGEEFSQLVFNVIKGYSSNGLYNPSKEILSFDSQYIHSFINDNLSSDDIGHVYFVSNYIRFLKEHSIDFSSEIELSYNNSKREFIELMFFDPDSDIKYEERSVLHLQNIHDYFETYSVDDYLSFIEEARVLLQVNTERDYTLRSSIGYVFNDLLEKDLESYLLVMKYCLTHGNPLEFNLPYILSDLSKKQGVDKTLEYAYSLKSDFENSLLMGILASAYKEEITKDHFALLCDLYRNSPINDLYSHLDFVLKYERVFKGAVAEIVSILLERDRNGDVNFAFIYSIIFNKYSELNKRLLELFDGRFHILKEVYFKIVKAKDSHDYDFTSFKKLYEYDNSFLFEYLEFLIDESKIITTLENGNFTFLWLYDDYHERMKKVSHFLRERDTPNRVDRILKYFFKIVKNDKDQITKEKRQDIFITQEIQKSALDVDYMTILFDAITEFSIERRKNHISTFLLNNVSFDAFKYLPIEPSGWSWSGSAVPMYQGRIDFLKEIKDLMEGLDFIEHRNYLDDRISGLRKWIKNEQKRDFLRDY
ncbi:MAG: ATP-binding protein [Balneolaceae bacterium]|nr:ATP-binding protein [Balneolaceae bacterium]